MVCRQGFSVRQNVGHFHDTTLFNLKPLVVMISAGEPSGDLLAAEWVNAFRTIAGPFSPTFFGVGGPQLAGAGVELAVDLTRHALIGIPTVGQYRRLRRIRDDLVQLALQRQPDVFLGVDFYGFNGSLAQRLREVANRQVGIFRNWNPRIVQFVSPQVWASRPTRANRMAGTHDLLLSILPFEVEWYRQRVPQLQVRFVGHPLIERYKEQPFRQELTPPLVVLLPGSRHGELIRHLPLVLETGRRLLSQSGVAVRLVLPASIRVDAYSFLLSSYPELEVVTGGLADALSQASLALACTGTVTLECAWHGVPTISFYRASPMTYAIGKRLVSIRYLAMPNLLACGVGEVDRPGSSPVIPELIQSDATPEKLFQLASEWLQDAPRRQIARSRLRDVVNSLGGPGASGRAAQAVYELIANKSAA